jgi:hypothetical protein
MPFGSLHISADLLRLWIFVITTLAASWIRKSSSLNSDRRRKSGLPKENRCGAAMRAYRSAPPEL